MPEQKTPLPKADKYIWAIYVLILLVSVVELYSASSREVTGSNVLSPIIRHGRMLLMGVVITVGLSRLKYKWLIPFTPIFSVIALFIGLYVLLKGDIINGARRSVTIAGIAIQSAELLKLAVVMVIAFVISRCQEKRGVTTTGVVICAAMVLACCGLLFSQGTTNTLLLMGISFAMMLIGGVQMKKFAAVILTYILVVGLYMGVPHLISDKTEQSTADVTNIMDSGKDSSGQAATLDRTQTRLNRMARWRNDSIPKYEQEITAENRQEMFSYMAQAHGGIISLPGNSRETSRLPLAFSDYIFAIVVEDWGLIGGLVLLGCYLALLARAGAIASKCSRAFPALLVMGMAVMIVLQALFHMAIVTGVFPVSGQPLPLISKGGSSILVTSIAFGIMLSVSRFAVQTNTPRDVNAEKLELPVDLAADNPAKL